MNSLVPTDALYPDGWEGDTVADLDWATGMLRYFVPVGEMERIQNAVSVKDLKPEDRYVLEALTHEHAHVLQLSTTGFGYDFSSSLFEVVTRAAREHQTLDQINAHRSEYAAELAPLFARLDRIGPLGLTPRAIMESAAFAVQKVTHISELGSITYEQILDDESPALDYRAAYDVAVSYLGGDALHHLPHIANLALLSMEPETVFGPLLEEFRDRASRLDRDYNTTLGLRVLAAHAPLMLGSGLDVAESGREHPVLQRILSNLARGVADGLIQASDPLVYGRVHSVEAYSLVLMPALFPPSPNTSNVGSAMPSPEWDVHLVRAMRWAFAVSQIIQQELPDVEASPLRPPASGLPRWDPEPDPELDRAIAIRHFEFDTEGRSEAGVQRFADIISGVEQKPQLVRALRGTVWLTVTDYPDAAPLLDLAIQRFFAGILDAVPHLLYYLSDAHEHGALLEVFAAQAPDALFDTGEQIGVALTPTSLSALVARLRDAAEFAVRQGQSASMVFPHLKALPDDLRAALESALV